MDDFIDVFIGDPKIQIKVKDVLDKYIRLPFNYQSKIGYDALIQNVTLKERINLMATTIVDIDLELKLKISSIRFLESGLL